MQGYCAIMHLVVLSEHSPYNNKHIKLVCGVYLKSCCVDCAARLVLQNARDVLLQCNICAICAPLRNCLKTWCGALYSIPLPFLYIRLSFEDIVD